MDTQEQARIRAQKQAQRQAGLEARRAMEPAARQAADAAICAQILRSEGYRRAERLLLYAATGGEVNLSAPWRRRPAGTASAWPGPCACPGHRDGCGGAAGLRGLARWGRYGIPAPVPERSRLLAAGVAWSWCWCLARPSTGAVPAHGHGRRVLRPIPAAVHRGARAGAVAYECQ